ncbi:MAG: iron-sulfur cluster assembly scaffold protein [Alphaproteobacteria bacterium]|nr:iron-sulfur cluster assembly scaffold protein [Alphaproteobacteria bacterium]
MSEDLYQKALLRLAASAHGAGRLHGDCCSGREANAMCGDSVVFDARVDGAARITEVANELKGCVLVQASASLLAEHAVGRSAAEVAALRADVAAMLEGGAVPGGVWAGYEVFKPAAAYKSRHSCVLLPIDALAKALEGCG